MRRHAVKQAEWRFSRAIRTFASAMKALRQTPGAKPRLNASYVVSMLHLVQCVSNTLYCVSNARAA